MPLEVFEVTKQFMQDPIRKNPALTLDGIKQFFIGIDREVEVGDAL